MKKLLLAIGHFFTGLFNAAKRVYYKLPQEVQDAAKWASGIIDEINKQLSETSTQAVLDAIDKRFPEIGVEVIKNNLVTIATNLKLIESGDWETALKAIQTYLNSLEGSFWAGASRFLATIGTIVFSPTPVKVEAIGSIIGYVYHELIKDK